MVKLATKPLNATFSALADPTRRAILARLARGEATVSTLARPYPMSLPAVSKHLRVLERAGLVQRSRLGRVHLMRLAAGPLRDAREWISDYERFWQERLDSLANFLDDPDTAE